MLRLYVTAKLKTTYVEVVDLPCSYWSEHVAWHTLVAVTYKAQARILLASQGCVHQLTEETIVFVMPLDQV